MPIILESMGDARPEDYPDSALPCVYSDGVASLAFGRHVVKFYLSRFDSTPSGKSGVANVPVAQVVMPIDAYCSTVQFLVHRLGALKGHDKLQKDTLTEIKRLCDSFLSA